jgi:alanine racemase
VSASAGARLTIDLDALAANYAVIGEQAGAAETAAVVKADGYGLGAAEAARRLWVQGARTFFVARLSEGLSLREALPDAAADILILDGLLAEPSAYRDAGLTPVLNSVDQARRWMASGAAGGVLQVDTGMNRLGVSLVEAAKLAADGLGPVLVMSHLACASDPAHPMNAAQLAAFIEARELFPDARASLANSAGIFLGADYHFDLVRPGIALYGGASVTGGDPVVLKPVASLRAPVLQVREVAAGGAVGYGADWIAMRPSRIAIVAAGYADGVVRAAAAGGFRLAGGLPLVGRISMDMLAIDVTDAPDVEVGQEIELFGVATSINDLAAAAGTIPYEVLTRISSRAERRYLGEA